MTPSCMTGSGFSRSEDLSIAVSSRPKSPPALPRPAPWRSTNAWATVVAVGALSICLILAIMVVSIKVATALPIAG